MTEKQTHDTPPHDEDSADHTEVTFHLGSPSNVLPFRWVAGIDTPHGSWRHRPDSDEELEQVTVDLPEHMSRKLIDFARRHIGPNATNQEIDFWCHTFAREVGATALSLTDTGRAGEHMLADAQAITLFSEGTIIPPSELGVGEHAVVGDARVGTARRAPMHSLVGIGRPKGQEESPNLAVQVDTSRGNLYVGNPADYLEDVKRNNAHLSKPPQPELYVQRTPLEVPLNHRTSERKSNAM